MITVQRTVKEVWREPTAIVSEGRGLVVLSVDESLNGITHVYAKIDKNLELYARYDIEFDIFPLQKSKIICRTGL